jgi:hypothetical protein
MTLLDATAFVLEAIMFTTFVALVFSAATGLRCELHIDDRQQVWHISADVEARAFTARSKSEKPITHQTAMMQVEYGFPEALDLVFTDKELLVIKLNGNAFLQGFYGGEPTYVGHCDQAEFEGL